MTLLRNTMIALSPDGQDVSPFDAPGVAVWIEDNAVTESTSAWASDFVDRAIADSPNPALATPEVHRLATLYHQARARLDRAAQPEPSADVPGGSIEDAPSYTSWWLRLRDIGRRHQEDVELRAHGRGSPMRSNVRSTGDSCWT